MVTVGASDLIGSVSVMISTDYLFMNSEEENQLLLDSIIERAYEEIYHKVGSCQFLECITIDNVNEVELNFFFVKDV